MLTAFLTSCIFRASLREPQIRLIRLIREPQKKKLSLIVDEYKDFWIILGNF